MNCPICGTGNTDGAAFCSNCGSNLAQAPAAAAVATSTDPGPSDGYNPTSDKANEDTLLPLVKQHLGTDYRIEKELGRGGMAVVYKGVEIALERPVAIKVVPPDSANVGQAAERFRREARLAASLDHANIIPVYRVGQAGPLHYMAMKFVEGRAVDSIIESQGALPLPVAIAILRYSAAGLAFAHEKKIVHRDIKGANVLVDKDGRVMVSDFGIARALEEVSLTASGMVIGTPYFMSPEQCGGLKVSPQSDQYSLGVMGFQMLTGEVPFNADSMVGIIQHHYMTQVPDILAVRPEVPRELLEVIYCSLNKDPKDRFTTTKEMAQALDAVPQTDKEREEAETLLKQLSAGQSIPKVRTGTLPPLALTISGPAAPVQPRPITMPKARPALPAPRLAPKKKKKKNKMLVPAVALVVVGVGGAVALAVNQSQASAKRAQIVSDSIAAANLAKSKGAVVFTNLPADVKVNFQGRLYPSGLAVSTDTGTYQADAAAPGYQPVSKPVTIVAGQTDTVDMTMTRVLAGSTGPVSNTGGGTTPQGRPAPGPAAGPVVTTAVRFVVSTPVATLIVDGQSAGVGRLKELQLTVGTAHSIQFACPGGTPTVDTSVTVAKSPLTTIIPPLKLTCP